MPSYAPPDTFYSEIKGIEDKSIMLKIIGKEGKNFKYLTKKLKISYIWWDMKRNVVEVWGPHNKLSHAKKSITKYMNENKGEFITNLEYAKLNQTYCM